MDSSSNDSEENVDAEKQRNYLARINFEIDNFEEAFRLSRESVTGILNKIGTSLSHPTNRNHSLDANQQLLITLHYLATNGFYHLLSNAHGIHKSTISRLIHCVVHSINNQHFESEINWPQTADKFNVFATEFY